jgi:hypothetical protein
MTRDRFPWSPQSEKWESEEPGCSSVRRGTKKMVDDGLEPPTVALLVRYSTD